MQGGGVCAVHTVHARLALHVASAVSLIAGATLRSERLRSVEVCL